MTVSKDPQVEAVPVSQCQPDEKDRPSPAEVDGHTSGRKVSTEERKIEQEKEPDAPEPGMFGGEAHYVQVLREILLRCFVAYSFWSIRQIRFVAREFACHSLGMARVQQ